MRTRRMKRPDTRSVGDGIAGDRTRTYATDDARLENLLFRRIDAAVIRPMAGVFAAEPVQVIQWTFFEQLRIAANLQVAPRIVRIHHQRAHLWIELHVPALLPLARRIDARAFAVIVDPPQTGLRMAIGGH